MRKWFITTVLLIVVICAVLLPNVSFTEDKNAIQLAQVIYALGKTESYETKLAIGSVVMNRVDSKWFADSIPEVLDDPQQFPCGERYDEDSLKAAHSVISGTRVLDHALLYYESVPHVSVRTGSVSVGSYDFFESDDSSMVFGLML